MFKNTKSDYLSWLVIIGIVILLMEILFFNRGLIFSLFIAGGMIYLGRKKAGKKLGKILFIVGVVFLILSIINMMTFRFLLLAILLHFFIQFIHTKKQPKKIVPNIAPSEDSEPGKQSEETLISSEPLFTNILLGQQKTPIGVYEWDDVNIQTGIGDTIIDLSYTMLPKGEAVIFIRNIVGNIHILIPYETEVSIHHSGVVGSVKVFGSERDKLFNQVFHLKTSGYDKSETKVKIVTSLVAGNLEVTRI